MQLKQGLESVNGHWLLKFRRRVGVIRRCCGVVRLQTFATRWATARSKKNCVAYTLFSLMRCTQKLNERLHIEKKTTVSGPDALCNPVYSVTYDRART